MKSKWKPRKKKSIFNEKDNSNISAIVVSYNDKYNNIYKSIIDDYDDKDITYYTMISLSIPYAMIIDIKSNSYADLLEVIQYSKLKLMVLNRTEDSLKIILYGSLYDAIDTVKSVPNQMINKLYRFIPKSLYQYDKRFFTDLIELNILKEINLSNKIYINNFKYDENDFNLNNSCILFDTKKDFIDNISNKYSISDTTQILRLSVLTVMSNCNYNDLKPIPCCKNDSTESCKYIYSLTYYDWIEYIKLFNDTDILNSSLLQFVIASLQDSLGMSFNEITALTIKPVSIARLYTYNSSFDPSIDEVIEDNID